MAKRQEQEPARREVEEVAPEVLRMQLPIRMPGLGHVNMYALVDDEGAAVVDPGLPGPGTWRAICDRLRQAGLAPRHVHTVVVTHSHPDHFGGAARFAREAGAKVWAHSSFRFGPIQPEVAVEHLHGEHGHGAGEGGEAAPFNAPPTAAAGTEGPAVRGAETMAFRRWGGRTPWGGQHPRPGWRTRTKWRLFRALGRSFLPPLHRALHDGEVVRLGGREWRIVHTPGHTEDHVCLHDPADGLFLAGDHVLPTITPHISGIANSADPLDAFFESLDRVAAIADVRLALPAHGHPFTDLPGRAEEIKKHHHERLEKVKSIGRELGPATVEAYSQRLFHPRHWGAMAESETFAHLEHLLHAGAAERREDAAGMWIYETG